VSRSRNDPSSLRSRAADRPLSVARGRGRGAQGSAGRSRAAEGARTAARLRRTAAVTLRSSRAAPRRAEPCAVCSSMVSGACHVSPACGLPRPVPYALRGVSATVGRDGEWHALVASPTPRCARSEATLSSTRSRNNSRPYRPPHLAEREPSSPSAVLEGRTPLLLGPRTRAAHCRGLPRGAGPSRCGPRHRHRGRRRLVTHGPCGGSRSLVAVVLRRMCTNLSSWPTCWHPCRLRCPEDALVSRTTSAL